ncbi:1322_t:CDS:2, partial [Cetraspora pellucida]
IFKREECYSIRGKIIPDHYAGSIRPKMSVATLTYLTINGKPSESNKCLLKVSLVGTPQGKPAEIENTDDCMIEVLMTDHAGGQVHDYTVIVIFSHTNPQFEHLKMTICLQESLIFVVGQME